MREDGDGCVGAGDVFQDPWAERVLVEGGGVGVESGHFVCAVVVEFWERGSVIRECYGLS